MNRTIVVASRNRNKIEEIKTILKDTNFSIVSLEETGVDIDIVEDGDTFKDNAYKKAFEAMKATGKIVLADDSGLVVDVLDGKPGVYSARFAGEKASDIDNNLKLLKMMENIPAVERRARFVCTVVVAFPDERYFTAVGECEGQILFEPRGIGGFGYDPLFFVPEYHKTFAELEPQEKNAISHRSRALQKMEKLLVRLEKGANK